MNLLPFALSFLRAHWKLIGAAFLLLALIIQTFRLSATEGALSAEKAGRQADLATYEKAQAQATSAALEARARDEAEYREKANAADASIDDLRVRLRAALVRQGQADRATGPAIAQAQGGDTGLPQEVPATTTGDSGSMCVNTDILAGLSAYAIKAHEWAVSLDQP